jgi:TRAP-type mannitol/chloroaromatic compound transport system substrate-binding protein
MNMVRRRGMNRRQFLRNAGVGAAGLAAAGMMGSGMVSAMPPEPHDYVMYGALPDGIKEITELSDIEAFLDLVYSESGDTLSIGYGGKYAAASGDHVVKQVNLGNIDFGYGIADSHGNAAFQMTSELYWGMPFGMEAPEFFEWLYEGGGIDAFNDALAAAGYGNVYALPLYLTPGEGGAWHTEPLPDYAYKADAPPGEDSFEAWGDPDAERWGYYNPNFSKKSQYCKNPTHPHYNKYCVEYSWTKLESDYVPHQYNIRMFGLGGVVLNHTFPTIGTPKPIAGAAALDDFKSSKYNAVEFYMPASDVQQYVDKSPNIVQLDHPATVFYENCWNDNVTMSVIWINKTLWNSPGFPQSAIMNACKQTMLLSYKRTIDRQDAAINTIRDLEGPYFVVKQAWPPRIIDALRVGALELYNEMAAADPVIFGAVLASMKSFVLGKTRWPSSYSAVENYAATWGQLIPSYKQNSFDYGDWEALEV